MIWRLVRDHFPAFGAAESERAAALFNLAGRSRAQRWACMIAAAAMDAHAEMATLNPSDFHAFAPAGLTLVDMES